MAKLFKTDISQISVKGRSVLVINVWPYSLHNILVISGQSYKGSTIVNYDSRVVPDLKIPHIPDSRVVNYDRKMFIKLATECFFKRIMQLTNSSSTMNSLYETSNAKR